MNGEREVSGEEREPDRSGIFPAEGANPRNKEVTPTQP